MNNNLSPNTQAILLLTAPLITGRATESPDLLTPGQYKRLAQHLRKIQHQPADLVSPDATEVIRACQSVIDETRLQKLLERGFLLSQAIERWQARAIWVVSRADPEYPPRLKARLREDAPAVLYGCGDISLLESGGLAVVGSPHVSDALIDYSMSVGELAARAGRTLISGGAKGIDQAAMRGALEAGGKACGVLANSLEKTTMSREHRNLLINGQLALISQYDPSAGFKVEHAMQRNKLIYALANRSLVVSSDVKKDVAWFGALEQLNKLQLSPFFIRLTGEPSTVLDALQKKGALLWPDPQDVDSFTEVFSAQMQMLSASTQIDSSQLGGSPPTDTIPTTETLVVITPVAKTQRVPSALAKTRLEIGPKPSHVNVVSDTQPLTTASKEPPSAESGTVAPDAETKEPPQLESTPAELLFSVVREQIKHLLSKPMKDTEVAAALDVSNAQARAWLQRLVVDRRVEKLNKPVRYIATPPSLFDD